MDQFFASGKPIDEGMYTDEVAGNFDEYDDEMGGAGGEAMMRIDSSTTAGSMAHHVALMGAEKIVHTDFFNDFGDLFDTDNFALNATNPGHVTA